MSVVSVARSRVASEHWSLPLEIGERFVEWLDRDGFRPVVVHHPASVRDVTTNVSQEFLRWRYGTPLLAYRVLADGDGVVILRARKRGSASELVLLGRLDLTDAEADSAVAKALRASGCSHCLRIGPANLRAGFVPVPGGGPVLTWRGLNQEAMPPLGNWQLGMGDVELF